MRIGQNRIQLVYWCAREGVCRAQTLTADSLAFLYICLLKRGREREKKREIFDALLSGSLNASYAIGIFNCLIAAKFLLG